MSRIKSYETLTAIEKKARNIFRNTRCNKCFCKNNCTSDIFAVCINAYTKGFVRGVKYHRQVIKSKKK